MSTTEQLAAMLRERHDRGLAKYGTTVDRTDLTTEEWAQHAIEEMLDGAAYLMRLKATLPEAIRRLEADNRELRERLSVALRQRDEAIAKAPSVPVGASEAPGEGGDSDRRRLWALERWLRSKEDVSIVSMENRCLALNETGLAVEWGWTLADLADKLMEKEAKP